MCAKLNVFCFLSLAFCLAFNLQAASADEDEERSSQQVLRRLEAMRRHAAQQNARQEAYLKQYLQRMQKRIADLQDRVRNMSETRQQEFETIKQQYSILVQYYKNFAALNEVRGQPEETKYYGKLRELRTQYRSVAGNDIPRPKPTTTED